MTDQVQQTAAYDLVTQKVIEQEALLLQSNSRASHDALDSRNLATMNHPI